MNPTSYPITEDECVNGPGFVMNKDEEQMFCKKKNWKRSAKKNIQNYLQ